MALLNAATAKILARQFPKEVIIGCNALRNYSNDPPIIRIDYCPNREQIGYGIDSEKLYYDRTDFPVPAVRYKVETPEIKVLREKEKGDWRKLTLDEKKELYRASFRMTFSEIEAPSGRWKSHFGWFFIWNSVALWLFVFIYTSVNRKGLRPSLSLEARQAQLQRQIALRMNPITGIASKWDYEKDDWKK